MRARDLRKGAAALFLGLALSAGLGAWESVRLVVYARTGGDYGKYMMIELRKALALPLSRREVRLESRGLDALGTEEPRDGDRVVLILSEGDMDEAVESFIADHRDDPRVFLWVSGRTAAVEFSGADAVTAATDDWELNAAALADSLVPFALAEDPLRP